MAHFQALFSNEFGDNCACFCTSINPSPGIRLAQRQFFQSGSIRPTPPAWRSSFSKSTLFQLEPYVVPNGGFGRSSDRIIIVTENDVNWLAIFLGLWRAFYLVSYVQIQISEGPIRAAALRLYARSLLSKKGSKKVLTKRPPFLVKSLVCKSSEKTVNGG